MDRFLGALLVLSSLVALDGCDQETSGWVVFPHDASNPPEGSSGGSTPLGGSAGETGGALGVGGTPSSGGIQDPPDPPFWEQECSPGVTFQNLDPSDDGIAVEQSIGAPTLFVRQAAQDVCRILYRAGSEVPSVPSVHLLLEDFEGAGTVSAAQIRLSTRHLSQFSTQGGNTEEEAAGMARFLLAHLYQHTGSGTPSWVITGKSDFVRLDAGFLDGEARSPGGTWTDGFRTTAYFFAHLVQEDADFIYTLNQRMAPGEPAYSDTLFEELTGSQLSSLWQSYQETFP